MPVCKSLYARVLVPDETMGLVMVMLTLGTILVIVEVYFNVPDPLVVSGNTDPDGVSESWKLFAPALTT